ncbi:MAG: hypothetical protein ACI80N_004277, partial [Gammaproteobacteria bacterium]
MPVRPSSLALQLCGLSLLVGACSETGASTVAYDAGTVISIELDGQRISITADEVDEWVPTIAVVEPMKTLPAHRRLALTNIVLPRVMAALAAPEAREEARMRAQDSWDVIAEGLLEHKDLLEMEVVEGTFKETGLDVWGMALRMQPEDWSPVFETVGAFAFFRFVGIPEPPWHPATPILIERALFPFVDPGLAFSQIEDANDRAVLTIVDPEWETLVPAAYR